MTPLALAKERLRRSPDDPDLLHRVGAALQRRGAQAAGESLLRRSLSLRETPPVLKELGGILYQQGRLEEALELQQRTAACDPTMAAVWCDLGQNLLSLQRLPEARAALARALELEPGLGIAHLALARLHFLEGDLPRGWTEFEWRFETGATRRRALNAPLWRGEPLEGRRLLVHAEQGLGDTLQFVRFLPRLAAAGARVILGCQPPLLRLLQGVAGAEAVLSHGARIPRLDLHCPLISVAERLKISLDEVPTDVPYITSAKPAGRTRLPPRGERFRVGLVWSGNPLHTNDRNRSFPLETLLPLLAVPRTRFFSLQVGPGQKEIARTGCTGLIENLAPKIQDFADTSALLGQLDLLITVDTAAVHLAGALGIETWLLLPHAPDWRWMLDRTDTPWYPTVRLFRRGRSEDRRAFVRTVTESLEARIAARS